MITKKTFYAIKAMSFLAKNQSRPAYSAEIAHAENIPQHFLEKILTELRNAGFLCVTKGHGGGYSIVVNPKEISVASVFQIMQGAIISSPCVDLNVNQKCNECQHKLICGICETFVEIRDISLLKLNATNFATLA
jgi:Rrf2 family protein